MNKARARREKGKTKPVFSSPSKNRGSRGKHFFVFFLNFSALSIPRSGVPLTDAGGFEVNENASTSVPTLSCLCHGFKCPEKMDPEARDRRRDADVAADRAADAAAVESANASTASASAPGAQASPEASPSKQLYDFMRALLPEEIDERW